MQAVDMMDPEGVKVIPAVLQPLTSVSATLTIIKSDMTTLVDRMVCFSGSKEQGKQRDAIKNFVDKSCRALMGHIPSNSLQKGVC